MNNVRGKLSPISTALAAALLLLSCVSCSSSSRKQRVLRDAGRDYDSGQYDRAEIEYKNVLQADPIDATAIGRLGMIYYDQGALTKAGSFLTKAHDLQPDNLEVQLKFALFERGAGKMAEARHGALGVLAKDVLNEDALVLLVETSGNQKEFDETWRRLEELSHSSPNNSAVALAVGEFKIRKHDLKGAEVDLRRAVALNTKSSKAYSALGLLALASDDRSQADQDLKTAAELAPARSTIRLQYAQFKIRAGKLDDAKQVLETINRETPDYLPAWLLMAEISARQGKFDAADSFVSKVLFRDAYNPEALLLSSRIKTAKGEYDKAIAELERTLRIFPHSAQVYYQLGQAYLASGEMAKAVNNLGQAIALAPDFPDATALLAQANIRKGDFDSALASLRQLVVQHPNLPRVWLLLADAYRGKGDLDGALDVYRQMDKLFPRNPETSLSIGEVLLQQNRKEAARSSFNNALDITPEYMPAVEQLINVDLAEERYSDAIKRAYDETQKHPQLALPQLFLAKIFIAQKDFNDAEAPLLKAIDLEPNSSSAYLLLASLYATTNRQEKALADLQKVIAKDPKNLGALMQLAIIYEQQKNYVSARDAYERILLINPRFYAALNNLAYLDSEYLDQGDRAFELAQRARELLPNEPHAADTLGWILYKRREFPWALSLLQESAGKLPTEAEVQFHLGMTRYMMGQEEPARAALQRALQSSRDFAGIEEAKKRLFILAIDPNSPGQMVRDTVEKSLTESPNDPIALARMAAIFERDGLFDKAVSGYESALAANPADFNAQVALVRLYMKQGNTPKAFDMAKRARKQEPDDSNVAGLLGRLAYETGDYQWAFSLFQEVVRVKPSDPNAQYDLANSAFSVGKIQDAEDAMHNSIQAGISGTEEGEAKAFLQMTALIDDPSRAVLETPSIENALTRNPQFAPARVALAEGEEKQSEFSAAISNYEKVLAEYPDFSPAMRRLAILYSDDSSKDQRTLDLAVKAREVYPGDSELEKALGMVVYRSKDFERAAGLFQESSADRSNDSELLFYLGMSRFQLKDSAAGRKAMQQALNLGLTPDLTAAARKALAEPN